MWHGYEILMISLDTSQNGTLRFEGLLTYREVPKVYRQALDAVSAAPGAEVVIDISGVAAVDSTGVSALEELCVRAETADKKARLTGASEKVAATLQTFSSAGITDKAPEEDEAGPLERLGEAVFRLKDAAHDLLYLTADTFHWAVADFFRPKARLAGSVVNQCVLVGVNALPIVGVLSFLVGFVLALQSAAQLRQFGANIYIADLIAISMMREMGPLMTAIILAGRSGSSFASEIATMKVTEELDALKSMALNPVRFVVVPKFYAMTLCAPLLTIMADVIGILGGFAIAVSYLQLSPQSFLAEALTVMIIKDVVTSIVKSIVFAWIIVLVGCYFGFQAEGGPDGVGRVTTKSVVASIFIVIVADSILGLLFYFGAPMA